MDSAYCQELGRSVDIDDFVGNFSPQDRRELGRSLFCVECAMPAYFRRKSISGARACFGANPHDPGCNLGSDPTIARREAPAVPVDEVMPDAVITLIPNDPIGYGHLDPAPGDGNGRGGGARVHKEEFDGRRRRARRRLASLLRRLESTAGYRDSHSLLRLPDGSRSAVREVCLHADQAERAQLRRRRIWWGTVFSARPKDRDGELDGAWLNVGSYGSPALVVDQHLLERLMQHLDCEELDDLNGTSFILWGRLMPSAKDDERWFWFVDSEEWFAVLPPID